MLTPRLNPDPSKTEGSGIRKFKGFRSAARKGAPPAEGPNAFGHVSISVNGDHPVGLAPKNNLRTKILGSIEGVLTGVPYGHTDGEIEQIAPGRKPKATATIRITPEQASKIRTFIREESQKQNQTYGLAGRNCAQFAETALKAGDVAHVPSVVLPKDLVNQLIRSGATPGP